MTNKQAQITINAIKFILDNAQYSEDVEEALNMAMSALTEQRWIPCSERLPDKPNIYEVTDHEGRVVRYVYNDNESSREYWKRCAKAWKPLPEPYREGE